MGVQSWFTEERYKQLVKMNNSDVSVVKDIRNNKNGVLLSCIYQDIHGKSTKISLNDDEDVYDKFRDLVHSDNEDSKARHGIKDNRIGVTALRHIKNLGALTKVYLIDKSSKLQTTEFVELNSRLYYAFAIHCKIVDVNKQKEQIKLEVWYGDIPANQFKKERQEEQAKMQEIYAAMNKPYKIFIHYDNIEQYKTVSLAEIPEIVRHYYIDNISELRVFIHKEKVVEGDEW